MNNELNFDHLIMKPEEVDFIIYHGNCMDGFGCVVSAELYRRDNFPQKQMTYYPASYTKQPPDVTNKNVLICDFSYKKNIMFDIIKTANKVVILDHHKTAENDLAEIKNENKVFNMNFSGSYITWKYFHPLKEVPKLIEYIQDNDIWKKQLPHTLEFTAYLMSLPMTYDEYSKLLDNEFIEKEVFIQGSGMVKQNQMNIDYALMNVAPKFMEIDNKYYFVCHLNSSVLKSEIGNKMLYKFPFSNFSVIYSINDYSNSTMMSLRSSSTRTDVSEIAKYYKGGGHRNASGLNLPYICNSLPGVVLDNNKCYYLLQNIKIKQINYIDHNIKIVLLNTSNCKYTIGKYLLQTRYIENLVEIQECSHIMRTINNNNDNYNCDMSLTWNQGGNDEIWCTVSFSDQLISDFNKMNCIINSLSKQENYTNKGKKITFSVKNNNNILDTNLFI